MKTMFTLLLCFLFGSLFSQTEKGAAPLNPQSAPIISRGNPQSTRAVVIGISDYREPLIPDLHFADRDAQAFADWLRSAEGLALPDSSIRLLTNQQATTAQMIVNLDWLIEASKPGDRAFIYFSGHGDVERVTKFNLGYLLSYDSPPAVYGAGAFSLQYLQAILSTLSENDVQVFIITDACRAGKLAGNSVSGTQVTATQLSQQFANEIKVLSCQPDEFSLEGEQWGGGRGCFSYHLEDALYGFADDNHDQSVDLLELRRYLEDHVSREAAPESQVPIVAGPVKTRVVEVREGEVAARRAAKGNQPVAFRAIENKGFESLFLENSDTTVQRLYTQFLAALDSGHLTQPVGHSADDLFKTLLQHSEAAPLVGTMKRKLAAALIEGGQVYVSKLMLTDKENIQNDYTHATEEERYSHYYERAAEILGEKHYAYKNLKAFEFYFKGRFTQVSFEDSTSEWKIEMSRSLFDQAIAQDSTVALFYRTRAFTYFPDRSNVGLFDIIKAVELAPNWALANFEIAIFSNSGPQIIKHSLKAAAIEPEFIIPYAALLQVYSEMGMPDSSAYWSGILLKTFEKKFEHDSNSVTAVDCNAAGIAYNLSGNYEKAKKVLMFGRRMSNSKYFPIHINLAFAEAELINFEGAIGSLRSCYQMSHSEGYLDAIANIYGFCIKDSLKAASVYAELKSLISTYQLRFWLRVDAKKALELGRKAPPIPANLFCLAESARIMNLTDTATYYFNKIIEIEQADSSHEFTLSKHFFSTIAIHRLGRMDDFSLRIEKFKNSLGKNPVEAFNHACFHALVGNEEVAIGYLQSAIDLGWNPSPLLWIGGSLCDPDLDLLRESDTFKALVHQHFPKYYDIATSVPGKD